MKQVVESMGPSARVAVELSEQAARELVKTILNVLDQAEAGRAPDPGSLTVS